MYQQEKAVVQRLKRNIDILVNSTRNDGSTPLHIASNERHLSIVKYLVEAGADPLSTDNSGKTALDWAREHCIFLVWIADYRRRGG